MLSAYIDAEHQYHRHDANDYSVVSVAGGRLEAQPRTRATKSAFMALQRAINRVRFALEMGGPIPMNGIIDDTTVTAARMIAEKRILIRPKGAGHYYAPNFKLPLNEAVPLAELRIGTLRHAFDELVVWTRLYTGVFNVIGDTIWFSTLTDMPPCELAVAEAKKSNTIMFIITGAVGLAAGAAAVFAILAPRLK